MGGTLYKKPNVIFITIDSLQPAVLGLYGNHPSPSPFLDQLFNNGFTLNNCFQSGQPTQFAMPGLLTSTLPLDHGGYSYGIRNRPTVLHEVFAKEGYRTASFSSGGAIRRLDGFDRGTDTFRPMYPANNWNSIPYFSQAAKKLENDAYDDNEVVQSVLSYTKEYLDAFESYCERRAREGDPNVHPKHTSPVIHDWQIDAARQKVRQEIQRYIEDPYGVTRELLEQYPGVGFVDPFVIDGGRKISNVSNTQRVRLGLDMLRTQVELSPYPQFAGENDSQQLREAGRIGWGSYDGEWSSARYILKNLYEWISEESEPLYAWCHVHDIHKTNMFSWEFDDQAMHAQESAILREYLQTVRQNGSTFRARLSYLLSVRYVDHVIKEFVENLQAELAEPPLIVITADHGTSVRRNRPGDKVTQFYDEQLHIPVGFSHPSLESKTIDGLCSALDIAPTLLDLLGIEQPTGFDGVPVDTLPPGGREYIIAEDLGRGACDYELSPGNLCIHSTSAKLLGSATDGEFTPESGYDLTADPTETDPIDPSVLSSEFDPLIAAGQQRAVEIHRSLTAEKPDSN